MKIVLCMVVICSLIGCGTKTEDGGAAAGSSTPVKQPTNPPPTVDGKELVPHQ